MAKTRGEHVVTTLLLVVLLDGFLALYIHGDVTLENIERVLCDVLFPVRTGNNPATYPFRAAAPART